MLFVVFFLLYFEQKPVAMAQLTPPPESTRCADLRKGRDVVGVETPQGAGHQPPRGTTPRGHISINKLN